MNLDFIIVISSVVILTGTTFYVQMKISKLNEMKFKYYNFALGISFIVIVLTIIGYVIYVSGGDSSKVSSVSLLFTSLIPLASIAGFYMVYSSFKEQSENSIRGEVHNMIKLQNKILDDIIIVEETPKLSKGNTENRRQYKGRNAFKKMIDIYNSAFDGFQMSWCVFILTNLIMRGLINNPKSEKAMVYLDMLESGLITDDVLNFCRANFSLFLKETVNNEVFKKLDFNQMMSATLFIRIYFDKKNGDQYLRRLFNLISSDESEDVFLNLTSPASGSTETNIVIINEDINQIRSKFYKEDFLQRTRPESQDLHLFLDTYFRNLYNSYNRIKRINDKELRNELSRLLRAQISGYEQAVIFLNSLCPMGWDWQKRKDSNLFKELNVIKNFPEKVIKNIEAWDVYEPQDSFKYKALGDD